MNNLIENNNDNSNFGNSLTAADPVSQAAVMAETQAAVFMAKQFPRDQVRATEAILNDCTRISLAANALWQYPRGNQALSGPSIRLAEVLAQRWGNIEYGIRELSHSEKESVVMSFAWDMETNARTKRVFTVPHEIQTRNGIKLLKDPRDIYELCANWGARRLRACILAIIPGEVTEQAVNQIHLTLEAEADTSPANQKKIIDKFKGLGVNLDQIETFLATRIARIRPAQVILLGKIYNTIRDGFAEPSSYFKPEAGHEPGIAGLKAALGGEKRDEKKEKDNSNELGPDDNPLQ